MESLPAAALAAGHCASDLIRGRAIGRNSGEPHSASSSLPWRQCRMVPGPTGMAASGLAGAAGGPGEAGTAGGAFAVGEAALAMGPALAMAAAGASDGGFGAILVW